MRTKTLLLTAALSAAGIASSMAQAYSVNAVGYVNVSIPIINNSVTFALASNPLNGTNNLLSTILPTVPDFTTVYLLRGGTYEIHTYLGGWLSETTVNPGEGFFIAVDPGAGAPNPTVLTFVGEVPQGNLSNEIPATPTTFSIRASQVPQAGAVQSVLGLPANAGDGLYIFNRSSQIYDVYFNLDGTAAGWLPSEPTLAVAESFYYDNQSGAAFNWTRSFSVNP